MRLVSIQALRGVAVLLVVSLHVYSFELLAGVGAPIMPALPVLGSSGVDLFFVISGFIMMHTTRSVAGTLPEIRTFLARRLWRIYPLYWLFTLALLTAYLLLPELTRRTGLTTEVIVGSLLLIPQSAPAVLPVAWTLTHELYFYLVFSLLLFLPRSIRGIGLGCWLAAILLASLVRAPVAANPWWALITHPLTFEFILGCAVWLLLSNRSFHSGPVPFVLGMTLLLAVAIGQPILENGRELAGWHRAVGLGAPYALILYSVVGMEAKYLWGPRSFLATLGDASYSIYLCHFPVLSLVSKLFAGLTTADAEPLDNLVYITCAYGASLGIGIAAYQIIETRILRVGKKITLNIGNAYVPSPAGR